LKLIPLSSLSADRKWLLHPTRTAHPKTKLQDLSLNLFPKIACAFELQFSKLNLTISALCPSVASAALNA